MLLFLLKLFATENLTTFLAVRNSVSVMVERFSFFGIFFFETDGPEVVAQAKLAAEPPFHLGHPEGFLVDFKGEPTD